MRATLLLIVLIPLFAAAGSPEENLRQIISEIEAGWENADGTPFRNHFLDYPGARYFESGGQNQGLDDLIDHHVVPEGAALKLELTFTNHQYNIHDDFAWVLVDTDVRGEIIKSGQSFYSKGFQTFVFQKLKGKWKVVHTHSSSRRQKET